MSKNKSLEKGIQILDLLADSAGPIGIREIAKRLAIGPSVAQRLVNTLFEYGYVSRDAVTRRYDIGYTGLKLSTKLSRNDNIILNANKELQVLSHEHGLNGYVGTRSGNRAIYLLSVQSESQIVIKNLPGEKAFLHTTAMGKVLLSALPNEEALKILSSEPLPRLTPKTIVDPHELVTELDEVRRSGYALVNEENMLGVASVGAPIRNSEGEILAALSVAFAPHLSPELTFPVVIPAVLKAARNTSESLGWRLGMEETPG